MEIKKYSTFQKEAAEDLRLTHNSSQLPTIFKNESYNETGVAVTGYGKGQVTGTVYTIPAHGEITVDFKLRLMCVTPENVQNLTDLIKSMLDASRQEYFREFERTHVSGGASFFGMFGWGGGRASYTKTKEVMESMGLSEENQRTIVGKMVELANEWSEFNYSGTIYNKNNSYSVYGSLFGIVMDADIKQDSYNNQLRFLAPNVHMQTNEGLILESRGKLYELNN